MNSEKGDLLEKLEQKRKLYFQYFILFSLFITIIAIPIFIEFLKRDSFVLIFLSIVYIVILSTIYIYFQSSWTNKLREEFIRDLIKQNFPEVDYYPKDYISKKIYHESRLFERSPKPDRYEGENLIIGRIGKTKFSLSWINVEYKETDKDSDDRIKNEWHTIFKGILIFADFNKDFSSTTVVFPESFIKISPRKLERVKLEDPLFESIFDVYGDNQIESRYILTPNFMERIIKFRQNKGEKIRLSFINSSIYIAIPTNRKFFKASSFFTSLKDIGERNIVSQYIEDLKFMTSFIEELDLNRRIWTKD
ncbi:MAG: DUF3137 domain-containing protein [Thermodesulfovibrio sp.]|nr:DUF3137 domain-containing protein [Thermodesulfovibrio sp.]MCX7725119.1 DUF3137 domain-containing protein [Thermodesulfovibrio sp.]MDW7972716.1 DUF3137 domain-containing protein [Thermodesulfovibrio sp.]